VTRVLGTTFRRIAERVFDQLSQQLQAPAGLDVTKSKGSRIVNLSAFSSRCSHGHALMPSADGVTMLGTFVLLP
jgi:hypothetical protein